MQRRAGDAMCVATYKLSMGRSGEGIFSVNCRQKRKIKLIKAKTKGLTIHLSAYIL